MFILWLCLVPSLTLLSGQVANFSTMPRLVMYSGVAKDASGKALTGTVGVTLALYADQDGGAPLWLETQNVHANSQGRFSVYLGATKPDGLPQDLFVSGEARWLGVRPEGQDEQPRAQLITVPYAMKAGDAETIGGLPPSAFVLAAPGTAGGTAAAGSSSSSASGAPTAPPLAGTGTVNFVPLWTPDGNTLGNSVVFQSGSGTSAKTGVNTTTPAATLDVNGNLLVRGPVQLPATGTANASGGFNSQPLWLQGSSYSSGTQQPINPTFQWQTEPSGNNTSSPAGSLNMLYGNGTGSPAETGLNISSNGLINFVKTQTFPNTLTGITAGTGVTVTGSKSNPTVGINVTFANQNYAQLKAANTFTASQTVNGTMTATNFAGNGSGLTNVNAGQLGGLSSSAFAQLAQPNTFTASQTVNGNMSAAQMISTVAPGTAPLQVNSTTQVPNLNASFLGGLSATAFQPVGSYATLGTNTFAGNQTVLGNISSNAQVSGSTVNAATGFSISGNLFDYGSLNTANEFFGFAGNQTMTGSDNVATGQASFVTNTTGNYNTADGIGSLKLNDAGSGNTAIGVFTLNANTGGSSNTGVGANTLQANTTGSNNTALGANAGPDSTHPALTNSTAIGANAQVTASNALVLGSINGVNGATADTNVGIGTTSPAAKLDVRGTANFGGLITFASGQTFPGAGTITAVNPGTGLSGGGTSGAVTLNLNNTYTDGRYAQLASNNTFSGVQTINNSVGIGTVPNSAFALQAIGTIRSETGGLSVGGNAPVTVDAPFLSGGRFTILPNGNVGINNPSPTTNLDVQGNIDARGTLIATSLSVSGGAVIGGGITTTQGITTTGGVVVGGPLSAAGNTSLGGSLTIKSDLPMNAAPRMYFSGFYAGNLPDGQVSNFIIPSKNLMITRMTMISYNYALPCSPPGAVSIQDWTTGTTLYNLNFDNAHIYIDSGPIAITIPAGHQVALISHGAGCGIFLPPNNVTATVEYMMQ
jgi:hypothetical protein